MSDGADLPFAAVPGGDGAAVEVFGDGVDGFSGEVAVFDLDEYGGFERFLYVGCLTVEGVDLAVSVWGSADACVESAVDAFGHFFAVVALDVGYFGA